MKFGMQYPWLPCPACGGEEGCDHTVPERAEAAAVRVTVREVSVQDVWDALSMHIYVLPEGPWDHARTLEEVEAAIRPEVDAWMGKNTKGVRIAGFKAIGLASPGRGPRLDIHLAHDVGDEISLSLEARRAA
jgi:hypothetical protein